MTIQTQSIQCISLLVKYVLKLSGIPIKVGLHYFERQATHLIFWEMQQLLI